MVRLVSRADGLLMMLIICEPTGGLLIMLILRKPKAETLDWVQYKNIGKGTTQPRVSVQNVCNEYLKGLRSRTEGKKSWEIVATLQLSHQNDNIFHKYVGGVALTKAEISMNVSAIT